MSRANRLDALWCVDLDDEEPGGPSRLRDEVLGLMRDHALSSLDRCAGSGGAAVRPPALVYDSLPRSAEGPGSGAGTTPGGQPGLSAARSAKAWIKALLARS